MENVESEDLRHQETRSRKRETKQGKGGLSFISWNRVSLLRGSCGEFVGRDTWSSATVCDRGTPANRKRGWGRIEKAPQHLRHAMPCHAILVLQREATNAELSTVEGLCAPSSGDAPIKRQRNKGPLDSLTFTFVVPFSHQFFRDTASDSRENHQLGGFY